MLLIQLNLHKAATLGVLARGCFIYRGWLLKEASSSSAETSQYNNGPHVQLVVTL